MIELTKNNKFGLKSPAIARHLIIHNNIYQFGKQAKLILILLLLLLLLLLVVEVLVNLPDTNAVTSLADLLLTTWWAILVQCGGGGHSGPFWGVRGHTEPKWPTRWSAVNLPN